MNYEKSPLDRLKELDSVSIAIESFCDESEDPERARKQIRPFVSWLLGKTLEAYSAMMEE